MNSLAKCLLLLLIGLGATILLGLGPLVASSQDGEGCTLTVAPGGSIQEALDTAAPGGVVCLEGGTFQENLVIIKSLTLQGAGKEATIIKGAKADSPVLRIDGEIEVTVEGLTLADAPGHCVAHWVCAHGLLIRGDAEVTAADVCISGNNEGGVRLWGTEWWTPRLILLRSEVEGNREEGIELLGTARLIMEDSAVLDNKYEGIIAWGESEATIIASRITGQRGGGISL